MNETENVFFHSLFLVRLLKHLLIVLVLLLVLNLPRYLIGRKILNN